MWVEFPSVAYHDAKQTRVVTLNLEAVVAYEHYNEDGVDGTYVYLGIGSSVIITTPYADFDYHFKTHPRPGLGARTFVKFGA
jgi:hypothetical protein